MFGSARMFVKGLGPVLAVLTILVLVAAVCHGAECCELLAEKTLEAGAGGTVVGFIAARQRLNRKEQAGEPVSWRDINEALVHEVAYGLIAGLVIGSIWAGVMILAG